MAAASGSVGTVKALLEAGAAHSTSSKGGATPLHVAAAVGGDDSKTAAVVTALVEVGAGTSAGCRHSMLRHCCYHHHTLEDWH
jgi:ankyrin repeat protein